MKTENFYIKLYSVLKRTGLFDIFFSFIPLMHGSGESAVLSFVSWLTLSGAEQSGLRGPSTEYQEAKQAAILCIKVLLLQLDLHVLALYLSV